MWRTGIPDEIKDCWIASTVMLTTVEDVAAAGGQPISVTLFYSSRLEQNVDDFSDSLILGLGPYQSDVDVNANQCKRHGIVVNAPPWKRQRGNQKNRQRCRHIGDVGWRLSLKNRRHLKFPTLVMALNFISFSSVKLIEFNPTHITTCCLQETDDNGVSLWLIFRLDLHLIWKVDLHQKLVFAFLKEKTLVIIVSLSQIYCGIWPFTFATTAQYEANEPDGTLS